MPPQLPTRQLGKNGPQVCALGFGIMGLSVFYGEVDSDEERFKILDAAYEMGLNNWDSADMYGDNEDLLGKWFARTGKRSEIFLSSKFGGTMKPDPSINSTPEYARKACEKSLKRLGIETIDLYYCHRLDRKTPIEKTIEGMVELKKEGKIKYIGLSECSAESIRRANKVHHIDAVQMEYSAFELTVEEYDVLKTCRELGIALVAYSPLGRGFLTGAYKSADDFDASDFRRHLPRFSPENFGKNLELVDGIKKLADAKGCTTSQLSLAWLLAQDGVIPIPGTKKIKYLQENRGALDVALSSEEEKAFRQLAEKAEVHGGRYAEMVMATLFADTPPL